MTDELKRESALFVNLGKAAASGRFADKMALRAVAQDMSEHIAKLQAENDRLRKDAARWKLLRDIVEDEPDDYPQWFYESSTGDELDDNADAQIAAMRGEVG